MNDWELLQDYAAHGSESAFRTLTERHLNLVYSAALRQVNDPQLAQEVCQTVFILLARKAGSLGHNVVLAGWLFRTTRFVAARARRSEQRRQRREQEAFDMQQLNAPEPAWPRLAPAIDEALARLGERDRNAVLLRFFENKNHKETAAALGVGEEAARKRVDRALEKLRRFFADRGFRISAAVLASALAAHAVQAAPVHLAAGLAATASAAGMATAATLPALTREVLNAWRWARVRLAASLTALVAAGLWLGLAAAGPRTAMPFAAAARESVMPARTGNESSASAPVSGKETGRPKPSMPVLRFHVVASDTHQPVGNAQLVVNTVVGGEWRQRFDLFTDAGGTAEVPYPPDTGRLDVGLNAWGWAARSARWTPGREDPVPAEYTFLAERVTNSMGGWLRDPRGQPVANAEILASFDGTGDSSNLETPRERSGFTGVAEAVVARSDSRGWWTCAIVPPRNPQGFTLTAKHPAFSSTTIVHGPADSGPASAENETLRLLWAGQLVTRMDAGLSLSGRVLDSTGRPVDHAIVAHEPYATDALEVATDADGRFVFTNLAARDFDFCVSAPGFAPEYRQVTLRDDLEPVTIELDPGAVLRLRVADESGEVVPGARVSLEQWGEHRHKLKWSAESGVDGRIEWISAPREGELELCATKDGWCYTRDLRFKADGQEHLVTLQRELEVAGWVSDAVTGRPITQFKAFPGYGDGAYAWERLDTRLGTDGRFVVSFQERQTPWRVRVEAEGYEPFVSDPLPPGFDEALNVALRPSDPAGAVRGVVLRPDGVPSADAEVALLTPEHSASLTGRPRFRHDPGDKLIAVADTQGRFTFGPEAKAQTAVAASPDGFARINVDDSSKPLTVQLQPWGRIEGSVETGTGAQPVESVVLTACNPDPKGSLRLEFDFARPDEAGRFAFGFVPPEPVCLYLNPGLGKVFHHRTEVAVAPGQTASSVIANTGPVVPAAALEPAH